MLQHINGFLQKFVKQKSNYNIDTNLSIYEVKEDAQRTYSTVGQGKIVSSPAKTLDND
jgi:hypothetical protein